MFELDTDSPQEMSVSYLRFVRIVSVERSEIAIYAYRHHWIKGPKMYTSALFFHSVTLQVLVKVLESVHERAILSGGVRWQSSIFEQEAEALHSFAHLVRTYCTDNTHALPCGHGDFKTCFILWSDASLVVVEHVPIITLVLVG